MKILLSALGNSKDEVGERSRRRARQDICLFYTITGEKSRTGWWVEKLRQQQQQLLRGRRNEP